MAKVIHNLDPNADTVLILKNPNASFAAWSQDGSGENATASVQQSAKVDAGMDTYGQEAPSTKVLHETGPVDCSALEEEIHYYVSSRHLTLSSPRFRNMLSGEKWEEGIPSESDGLYHIPSEDWDAEALLLLLDVLHHRNRQVPHTISLEMLAKLAVLIDFYECAEAMEPFTERWIKYLKVTYPVPSHFCRDLMLWMCIAWVLRLPNEFVQTTTVAIGRGCEGLPTLGLPIVRCVDRIEEIRMTAIGIVISQLQDLIQEYRSPLYQCPTGASFECGSILFGALTKEMELQGLLPAPTEPFSGLSFLKLSTKLQSIRSPYWGSPDKGKKNRHHCNLGERVMEIANPLTRFCSGPQLEDFEIS